MKIKSWILAGTIIVCLSAPLSAMAAGTATDKTTKFRVYQNNQALMEFSDYKQAEAFAKGFGNSHVEEIGTRKWLWNNFPRYQVFQLDASLPGWTFATLDQAISEASKWSYASIRDLQSNGWVWNNYPRYRVYQGDITLDAWTFTTLNQATAEAKKWGGAHIIDLSNNRWVWDNLPAAEKTTLRTGVVSYKVYQGTYSADNWQFAYLEDAINEALHWGGSTVLNVGSKQVVYSNNKPYRVFQNDNFLMDFISLDEAADYARLWGHSSIQFEGRKIWNNIPSYQVYQSTNSIGEFSTILEALNYSTQYSNSSIEIQDHTKIWDNFRKLQVWGWNGSSANDTIKSHVNGTVGLDVDSPTYFQLADADGNLTDTSNKDTVTWLKNQGLTVYPLVSNQFNAELTTAFLANSAAQSKFIQALVNRSADLGVDGINVDFESLAGKDRAGFTAFMQNLTNAAHQKGLIISVDLSRGSIKWNAQTAFDHEKLGSIVDYIAIMAYDQFWKGSTSAGSVAGLSWTEDGIKEFLSYGIPRDKIILGIPYYVREWKIDGAGKLDSNRTVLMKDIPALIASKKATLTWDNEFKQYRVDYQENGYKFVFWLENEDTVKARLDIAKKYDIAGVAAWRLGYDTPDLWKMILQNK
jgi:spore germination protein YaaH